MIERDEIEAKSAELAVHTSNVQRDYAFGWLLSAFYQPDNPLQRLLILKGGNCLRKAYFEHARYSNDLDFSTQEAVDPKRLLDGLKQACTTARARSGIDFLVDDSRVSEKRMADAESRFFEARVYFRSFYGVDEDLKLRVNLDFKEFDAIVLPIQTRRLIHSYSDAAQCQAELRCMKLEELLASKLRALLQRRHSPDLYDFVHSLFFQKTLAVSRREVLTTFLKQTIYEPDPQLAKGLLLQLPFEMIRGFWNEYLACPKLTLFSFDDAQTWFRNIVEDLFAAPQPRAAFAGARAGVVGSFYSSPQREAILEAGRLGRLLKVVYDGYERVVEPYSLTFKRPKDGVASEYFYVWDRSGGSSGSVGIKSFFANKLQAVSVLDETFEPRFPIELAKDSGGFFSTPFSSTPPKPIVFRPTRLPRAKVISGYGISYTVACLVCDKKFKREKYDTKLNEHKDKYGNRCFGRVGYIV
ncbi:nucleotidyl transferase AbiEii/AbiGii toxin family protein [Limnobacter humi]|uniref:Nucleotidyl transferase AbiEii/AbiGii toxin family protein n=1 Tax=Limnobacter humi TaxID=1778671 RepID=A0ABT1WFN1_9BURK|nr:nucleotidyl transferase AbiEii/AbiGii toxin family protein [Limnobacter humi]MCQ8895239.1 nucleotidyl transferase AbiEii/AbiGii toxin family protein [Limnobacter humi]